MKRRPPALVRKVRVMFHTSTDATVQAEYHVSHAIFIFHCCSLDLLMVVFVGLLVLVWFCSNIAEETYSEPVTGSEFGQEHLPKEL